MYNKKMYSLGAQGSVIREIFEYGKARKALIGDENVFDFSLGNPSVPAPDCINETVRRLLDSRDPIALHGYTSSRGDMSTRSAIADDLRRRFDVNVSADDIIMTLGAAASLSCALGALCEDGDEFIVISPFFPEYRVFVEAAGGKLVEVPADPDRGFSLDIAALDRAIGPHTKAVIINSPNNPTGRVYSAAEIADLADLLTRRSSGREPIMLISDEPYRELIYGDEIYPFVTKYYKNSMVCYSYSKSLSLAGERIGYLLVCPDADLASEILAAAAGAARALGYVCAPSLFQAVIAECSGALSDVSVYDASRKLLSDALWKLGFDFAPPDGAFYLFLRSPSGDADECFRRARDHELLLVPSDSFGVKGYLRVSYCTPPEMIERALPAFEALARDYGLLGR